MTPSDNLTPRQRTSTQQHANGRALIDIHDAKRQTQRVAQKAHDHDLSAEVNRLRCGVTWPPRSLTPHDLLSRRHHQALIAHLGLALRARLAPWEPLAREYRRRLAALRHTADV